MRRGVDHRKPGLISKGLHVVGIRCIDSFSRGVLLRHQSPGVFCQHHVGHLRKVLSFNPSYDVAVLVLDRLMVRRPSGFVYQFASLFVNGSTL